jgi:hypothetical protein
VTDAPGAGHVLGHRILEGLYLADATDGSEGAMALTDGYASRIVAPVFEALESFEQYGRGSLGTGVTDNSAHL